MAGHGILIGRRLMGLGRVELPTYGLGNRRSIHLSYSPADAILSELSGDSTQDLPSPYCDIRGTFQVQNGATS
jgi:hypothetical protein